MQLHTLKKINKIKTRKRVGRGGKRGTYSGRGMKGQKSRAGTNKFAPVIRELIKRYPKLKGYRSNSFKNFAVVNLSTLEKNFKDNETVNPKALYDRGLVRKIKGRVPKVKILGNGELVKKLKIEGCLMSKKAEEKLK